MYLERNNSVKPVMTEETVKEHRVIRLLRCRRTNRYFREPGWTEDLNLAKAFPCAMEAVLACARHGLSDVELVLRTTSGDADLFTTDMR